MSEGSLFPLSRSAGELLRELREEIQRLRRERSCFHELPPGARLGSLDAYDERIKVRLELLALLEGSVRHP